MSVFKKPKSFIFKSAITVASIGAIAAPVSLVLSCSATETVKPVYFNNNYFSSVNEFKDYVVKNNILTERTIDDGSERWSIDEGNGNLYFNSPSQAVDYVSRNYIKERQSYLSNDILQGTNQVSDGEITDLNYVDNGRIVNFPISSNPNAIKTVYLGNNDVAYLDKTAAINSYLQVHNAYFFDNLLFQNKEDLQYYLSQNISRISAKNEVFVLKSSDGQVSSPLTSATNLFNSSIGNRNAVSQFVASTAQRYFVDKANKATPVSQLTINDISEQDVPYFFVNQNDGAKYVVDVKQTSSGALFGPYVLETPASPVRTINKSSFWEKTTTNYNDVLSVDKFDQVLFEQLVAYALITDKVRDAQGNRAIGNGTIAEILFANLNSDPDYEAMYPSSQYSNDFSSLRAELDKVSMNQFSGLSRTIGGGLVEVEQQMMTGQSYSYINTISVLRSWIINQLIVEGKPSALIRRVNLAFDNVVRFINYSVHKKLDRFLSADAKAWDMSTIFDFANSNSFAEPPSIYFERMREGRDARNRPAPSGNEFLLAAALPSSLASLSISVTKNIERQNNIIKNLQQKGVSIGEIRKYQQENRRRSRSEPINSSYGVLGVDALFSNVTAGEFSYKHKISREDAEFLIWDFKYATPKSIDDVDEFVKFAKVYTDTDVTGLESWKHNWDNYLANSETSGRSAQSLSVTSPQFLEMQSNINSFLDKYREVALATDDLVPSDPEWDSQAYFESFKAVITGITPTEEQESSFQKFNEKAKNVFGTFGGIKGAFDDLQTIMDKIGELQPAAAPGSPVSTISKITGALGKLSNVFTVASAVMFIADTILDIVNAIIGEEIKETYRYIHHDNATQPTYYWNGGKRTEHSFWGIKWESDVVSLKDDEFLVPLKIAEFSPKDQYYYDGVLYDSIETVKHKFLENLKNGIEYQGTYLGVDLITNNQTNNKSLVATSKELVHSNPNASFESQLQYVVNLILSLNATVTQSVIHRSIITSYGLESGAGGNELLLAQLLRDLKPVWIAQLPKYVDDSYQAVDYRIPAFNNSLYYPSGKVNNLDLQPHHPSLYLFYNPNTNIDQRLSNDDIIDYFKNEFLKRFAISEKLALQKDILITQKYSALPMLPVEPLRTIYEAKSAFGAVEYFIDQTSAIGWVLAQTNFRKYVNSKKVYIYNNVEFSSITEFVSAIVDNTLRQVTANPTTTGGK